MSRKIAKRYDLHRRLEALEAKTQKSDSILVELPLLAFREGVASHHFAIYTATCPPEMRLRLQCSPIFVRWHGYRPSDRAGATPEEVARCEEVRRQWLMDVWTRAGLREHHIACGKIEMAALWPTETRSCLVVVGRALAKGQALTESALIELACGEFLIRHTEAIREFLTEEKRAWLEKLNN